MHKNLHFSIFYITFAEQFLKYKNQEYASNNRTRLRQAVEMGCRLCSKTNYRGKANGRKAF